MAARGSGQPEGAGQRKGSAEPPLRVRLSFHPSVAPFLSTELKAWEEPKVWLLVPPPLQKVADLVDYIALSYLTKLSAASSHKRKASHKPADLSLLLDGFALMPDEVSASILAMTLRYHAESGSARAVSCSMSALSVITTHWSYFDDRPRHQVWMSRQRRLKRPARK